MDTSFLIAILMAVGSIFAYRKFSCKTARPTGDSCRRRLTRIHNASLIIQILITISLAFGLYVILAHLCGWPVFSDHSARHFIVQGQTYTTLAEVPGELQAWLLVKTGLGFAALTVLFLLFGLYRRGILFSARNVLYIRFQGYCLILNFIADYLMRGALHEITVDTTELFAGLLIIFISWIMDEGRKIQEEQELTV